MVMKMRLVKKHPPIPFSIVKLLHIFSDYSKALLNERCHGVHYIVLTQ